MRLFQGFEGIPTLYWYGEEGDFRIMVTDLLGPSLEDLFNYSGRKFSLKTVLMLADQFIVRIQNLHDANFIHRDIKPENFLMGLGKKADKLFMIDFGLARKFRDPRTGLHMPNKEDKTLTGTARYASINSHLGIEQSRRDDLEALSYVLIYFLRGNLPWQGVNISNKKEKYEKILEKKVATPLQVLCDGLPEEFSVFLKYSKSLKFEERPDYTWVRRLFKDLMGKLGFAKDLIFDWAVLSIKQEQELLEEQRRNMKRTVVSKEEPVISGLLKVVIICCKNLPNFDMVGASDPYCQLSIIGKNGELVNPDPTSMATEVSNGERLVRRTHVIEDDNNPIWGFQCEMRMSFREREYEGFRLLGEVFDYDQAGDELIGSAEFDMRKVWKKPGVEKERVEVLRDGKGNEWKGCELVLKIKWEVNQME